MKSLLLLRHAKSSWDDPNLPDQDRPLNPRGNRDAPRMGRWLKDACLTPDLVLCSTARRARETAEKALAASGFKVPVEYSHELYLATPSGYIEVLRGQADVIGRVLIVGHNPGLEDLLRLLTGSQESLPTAALAQVKLPIGVWPELSPRTHGTLISVWRPKDLGDSG